MRKVKRQGYMNEIKKEKTKMKIILIYIYFLDFFRKTTAE